MNTSLFTLIRRTVVAGALAAAVLQSVNAIPADPKPRMFRQPDGSWITLCIKGDERANIITTADGYPVVFNRQNNTFEYARLDGSRLLSIGITASDEQQRSAAVRSRLSAIDKQAVVNTMLSPTGKARHNSMRKAQPSDRLISNFPKTGSPHALVILLSFSDIDFMSVDDPGTFYSRMMNEEGFTYSNGANGSARDFFVKNSMGLFTPTFDVVGPVKLSNKSTYYGTDTPSQDYHMGEAIEEACKALDDEIDFSTYDTNDDGEVDNIYFIYAGNGQADTPDSELIWPHSADLREFLDYDLYLDGVRIGKYACGNEIRYSAIGNVMPSGIGTFVHEFGHVLGLIDHYDIGYGMLTCHPGEWDTMANGSYNNNMNTPPLYSGFERAELGWLDYIDLTVDADSINLLPNIGESNKAYRVRVQGNDDEWFVLENRQQSGWDEYLPAHGMLMWHIDYDKDAWACNAVNVVANHQRVDIVEADGVATTSDRSGDIMPGSANVTRFDLKAWNDESQLVIDNVKETDGLVRLLVADTKFVLPAPQPVSITQVADSSFHITWAPVDMADNYQVSVYSNDTEGNHIYVPHFDHQTYLSPEDIGVDGLTPDTSYYVEVSAQSGSYQSAAAIASATTLPLAFNKKMPTGLTATDITDNGFTATWDAVTDADDYAVNLYHIGWDANTSTQGYDFSDKSDGMPQLWSNSSQTFYSVKGYYGEDAPSLRFSSDGDYLTVAYPDFMIDELSFWCRSKNATGALLIETRHGDQWTTAAQTDINTVQGETFTISSLGNAEAVRITYKRTDGYVVIDDVKVKGYGKTSTKAAEETLTGGETHHSFQQLATGEEYAFTVTALQGDVRSCTSTSSRVKVQQGAQPGEKRSITLGYADGEVSDKSTVYIDGKTWSSAAIRIPASVLQAYEGADITKVRAGLASKLNIDSLRVWIRSSLEGDNLAEALVTKTSAQGINKGWNELAFDHPLTIAQAEGDLYIGYDFHQRGTVYCISMVGTPVSETSFVKLGNKPWADYSDMGVLSIEAVAEGTTIPQTDLSVMNAYVSPMPTKGAQGVRIKASLRNNGTSSIEGFRVMAVSDSGGNTTYEYAATLPSCAVTTIEWTDLAGCEVNSNDQWTITVELLHQEDERVANNSAIATLRFVRNALVEEFTTEKCVNCPRAATYLHQAIADEDYGQNIVAICRHAGYYTDSFTQSCDEEYLWFYNNGSSFYAPAMMVNRRQVEGTTSAVFNPQSAEQIVGFVAHEVDADAQVMLGMTTQLSTDGNQLTIEVYGLKNDKYDTDGKRLCIALLENDVPCEVQAGADKNYLHQHVNRAYNSTWGELPEWDGNTFKATMTIDLQEQWNPEHLEGVAYIGRYNPDDVYDNVVDNAVACPMGNNASGISQATTESHAPCAVYDISGRRVSSNTRGIVVVRQANGKVRKMLR